MNKKNLFIVVGAIIINLVSVRASAQSCVELFREEIADEPDTIVRKTGRQPIDQLFIKEELELLFLFRERLYYSRGQRAQLKQTDVVLQSLIERINVKVAKFGKTFDLKSYEEQVLLPAFQGLALDLAFTAHKKYPGVALADLQQAALLGLLKGIRAYSSTSHYMLSTVAHNHMVFEINEALRVLRYPVAFSGKDYSMVARLIRFQTEMTRSLRREPTIQEIVDKNNSQYVQQISVATVENILKWQKFVMNIDSTVQVRERTDGHEESHDIDPLSRIADSKPTPEQQVYFQQLQNKLGKIIEIVSISQGMKVKVLNYYHGFFLEKRADGTFKIVFYEPLTMEDISTGIARVSPDNDMTPEDRDTISRSGIAPLVARARRTIKQYISAAGGKEADDMGSLFDALLDLRTDTRGRRP